MGVEKTFLKIGFINDAVELQVILQSCSLLLERGKYDRKQERYHSKLGLKLCEKDGMCNLNQTPFMNMGILSGHSTACLSRTEHFLLSIGRRAYPCYHLPKSFILKKIWVVGLYFASWLSTIISRAFLPDSQNASV